MNGLQTCRAAILGNYVVVAKFVGLDPFAMLKRAQIDPRWLDDPDAPLELGSVVQVMEESASQSGRDDFGVLLAETRIFSGLGPVALVLEHEHSVRSLLQAAIEFREIINEPLSIQIEEDLGSAFIHFLVPAPFGTPQVISHIVAMAAAVLMDASGGAWRPSGAHFGHARPLHIASYARHFKCPLYFEEAFNGLTCESKALDTPLPSAEPLLATYARRLLILSPEAQESSTFSHQVRNAIQLALRHGSPTMSKVSANFAMTSRTLQRLLREEGQTFGGLLQEVRGELATRELAQSRQDMTQIAYNLGFASPSSFSRWFAGQLGVPPSTWRKMLADPSVRMGS